MNHSQPKKQKSVAGCVRTGCYRVTSVGPSTGPVGGAVVLFCTRSADRPAAINSGVLVRWVRDQPVSKAGEA